VSQLRCAPREYDEQRNESTEFAGDSRDPRISIDTGLISITMDTSSSSGSFAVDRSLSCWPPLKEREQGSGPRQGRQEDGSPCPAQSLQFSALEHPNGSLRLGICCPCQVANCLTDNRLRRLTTTPPRWRTRHWPVCHCFNCHRLGAATLPRRHGLLGA
jgi:hypothetical protein